MTVSNRPKRLVLLKSSCWLPASISSSGGSKSKRPEPHVPGAFLVGNKFPARVVPLDKNWRPGQIPQEARREREHKRTKKAPQTHHYHFRNRSPTRPQRARSSRILSW